MKPAVATGIALDVTNRDVALAGILDLVHLIRTGGDLSGPRVSPKSTWPGTGGTVFSGKLDPDPFQGFT
jgi:hypothetical protein